jgi:hypothetical protein
VAHAALLLTDPAVSSDASGGNAFSNASTPGYFSFLSKGSDVSGADPSNADYEGAMEALKWMQVRAYMCVRTCACGVGVRCVRLFV